ncbi:MAG: hypothetical protein MK078_15010 [Crocinitomicaceae bacterium]|nr:hypothetical protein [Crocinitomicaceae bacterium]
MEEALENVQDQPKQRPVILTILCILSSIFSGIMGVFLIVIFFFLGTAVASGDALPIMLIAFGIWALGLIAIILMWKLRRIGFYLYVVSNIVVTSLQIWYTGDVSYMTIAVPVIFIAAFASQVKSMR